MSDTRLREPAPARTSHGSRSASTLLLAGAVLLVVSNASHPADTDPSALSRLPLATSPSWVLLHLIGAMGVLLVVGGLVALHRLLPGNVAEPYARFGATAAIVGGTALAIVFAALDGYAQHSLATDWETADEGQRTVLEGAATALEAADSGLAALGIFAFFGLAMLSYGRALVASRLVPRALGWAAVALGAVGLATGVVFALEGPTAFVINALFRPVALGTTLYVAVLGIALRRT